MPDKITAKKIAKFIMPYGVRQQATGEDRHPWRPAKVSEWRRREGHRPAKMTTRVKLDQMQRKE